jgi:hypothetical protein
MVEQVNRITARSYACSSSPFEIYFEALSYLLGRLGYDSESKSTGMTSRGELLDQLPRILFEQQGSAPLSLWQISLTPN